MEKIKNEITTKEIISRDSWRVNNYKESLRGYQVRPDILENMFRGLDFKELANEKEIVIADIGCGPGICGKYFTEKIAESSKDKIKTKTFFVDISQQMLDQIPDKENYSKIRGDITSIPLATESVDIVSVKQVLDYLPKNLQARALKEIYRVLKNDGQFILSALIAPDSQIDDLTNHLYSEREKIIAAKVAIEKFIPDESGLLKLLKEAKFDSNILYRYDIPLSTEDFKKSFNLTDEQQNKLKALYKEIILLDKNNHFRKKEVDNDIELVEKGIILKLTK